MKVRNVYFVAVAVLLCACHKEENNMVQLCIEYLNGGSKLLVDNTSYTTATWTDGDYINFNGELAQVEHINGDAYIRNVTSLSVNRACFPATLAASLGSDAITVNLPTEYHYRTSGARQMVDMPLVARASDGDPLEFKHLTSALCITIKNTQGVPLAVDRVTVGSDAYLLSGSRSVDLTAIESFGPQAHGGSVDTTVTMYFDKERLTVASDGSATVLIPVPPVGSGNHFTVTVVAHNEGSRYTYRKTQTAGGVLDRNVLAYAHFGMTGGSPTKLFDVDGSTYYIRSAVDFVNMVDAVNNKWTLPAGSITKYSSCSFKVDADLDMSGITIKPITGYTGATFDGNNKTISNLTVADTSVSPTIASCGLFSKVPAKTVQNLTLRNLVLVSTQTESYLYMGGLAGEMVGATITGCTVDGLTVSVDNISSAIYLGGIAGHVQEALTLTNVAVNWSQSFSLSVPSVSYGGMLGYCEATNTSNLTMSNCDVYNSPLSINTGQLYAGGFIGYASSEHITMESGCNWATNMTFDGGSSTIYVGGLVGYLVKGSYFGQLSATNCTVSGTITANTTGTNYVGACVGYKVGYPSVSFSGTDTTDLNVTGN